MLSLAVSLVLLIIYFVVKKNFYSETLVGYMVFSVIALLIELYASLFPIRDGGVFFQLAIAESLGVFSLIFIIVSMFFKAEQNNGKKKRMTQLWLVWVISVVLIVMGIIIPTGLSEIEVNKNNKLYEQPKEWYLPLKEYTVQKLDTIPNKKNDIEFNGRVISMPLETEKNEKRNKGVVVIEYRKATNNENDVVTYDPIIIIFNKEAYSSQLPEIGDKILKTLYNKIINLQRSVGYEEKYNALNKVPAIQDDGTYKEEERYTPEIQLKQEILHALAPLDGIQNWLINYYKPTIKGFLHEGKYNGSTIKIAEIYEKDILKYTIIVRQDDPNQRLIDYILCSMEK